uniref:Phosphoinositide phospholipase C n=1 Tax=Noccaea caerulescens TaxID=107243 RepID=A0A1J3EYL8_NOCCA
MGSYRMCLIFTRKFRVTEPGPVDDVREVFEKYAEGEAYMSPEQLQKLVAEKGGGGLSLEEAERIVDDVLRRKHHIAKFTRRNLTLEDFNYFLFSTDLNPPIADQVHQKMDAPLSHYFIYTGHNSYLTGNQLSSNCSDLPIADALKRGVRVVELDLWPRGNDDVCVKHGRTLTKAVKLGKCLESIKANAFTTSKYPVIITLEDHLTPKLQSKVAKMITQTFGDMLYYHDSESCKEFPSPEDLKGKILISTKPPKEYLEANDVKEKDNGEKGKDSDEDVWGKEPSDLISTQSDLDKLQVSSSINYLNQDDEEKGLCESDTACQLQAPEYKRLIAIHAGKPKGGLRMGLKVDPNKIRRLSLSEQLLEKAVASYGPDVIRFTQKNFLRIYPKGTRFNSSNYKPQIGWMSGAQMIAFNMQGHGRALWLMQGMFRANGGCGYVKKPDFLMNVGPNGKVFDPNENAAPKKTLKVKVCMGDGWHLDFKKTHFDLYSPPDFFVRVGIAGAPVDEVMKKTEVKYDTWTPIWNEEFTFKLTVPELALLRVEVHEYDANEKDDFGGQTCLPVSELRQGIRAVPLYNRKGEKYSFTRLLMRFEFV